MIRAQRQQEKQRGPQKEKHVFVNSHSTYTGRDAERRTQLSHEVQAELDRIADAHTELLESLGVQELQV